MVHFGNHAKCVMGNITCKIYFFLNVIQEMMDMKCEMGHGKSNIGKVTCEM